LSSSMREKIDEIKGKRKEKPNPLRLTKEELRLLEQVEDFKQTALSLAERKAYEKVILTIQMNAVNRLRD
jgi:hypothetical protein